MRKRTSPRQEPQEAAFEAARRTDLARLFKGLRLCGVPTLGAAVLAWLNLTNSQIRDMIQVLLENQNRWHGFVALFDLCLLVATIGFVAHWVLSTTKPDDLYGKDWVGFVLRGWTMVIPALPPIAWIYRVLRVGYATGNEAFVSSAFLISGLAVLASAAGYAIFFPPPRDPETGKLAPHRQSVLKAVDQKKDDLYSLVGGVYALALFGMALGGLLFMMFPFGYGKFWGPLAHYFVGSAVWVLILGGAAQYSEHKRIPILNFVFIPFVVVHFFNWQSHRSVEIVPAARRLAFDQAFQNWLDSRPDKARYDQSNDPYPVILVSAEGGGIRAAALTALALAKMDENIPGFSDHVFVISGVSGGTVGAGMFLAALDRSKETGDDAAGRTQTLKRVLSQDYISGALGRLFFTDIPTSWLPLPTFRFLDRSDALTRSFREGWTEVTGDDRLGKPLSEFDFTGPTLVANSTSVSKRSPFVVSRLDIAGKGSPLSGLSRLSATADLRLADAICISARFPGISSIGVLSAEGRVEALVDGGFYDNSGLNTTVEIMSKLLAKSQPWNCRYLVLRIGSNLDTANSDEFGYETKALPRFVEPLSVPSAAANVYLKGIVNSDKLSKLKLGGLKWAFYWRGEDPLIGKPKWTSIVNAAIVLESVNDADKDDVLPLGWIISSRSIKTIETIIGSPVDHESIASTDPATKRNESSQSTVLHWLTPGFPAPHS